MQLGFNGGDEVKKRTDLEGVDVSQEIGEIMGNLFREMLMLLEKKDCDLSFVEFVESPLLEAVMNHCDSDIERAAGVLNVTVSSLEKRLRQDFGSARIGEHQILLRKMRGRK